MIQFRHNSSFIQDSGIFCGLFIQVSDLQRIYLRQDSSLIGFSLDTILVYSGSM